MAPVRSSFFSVRALEVKLKRVGRRCKRRSIFKICFCRFLVLFVILKWLKSNLLSITERVLDTQVSGLNFWLINVQGFGRDVKCEM